MKIAIASYKGGVGKTSLSFSIAKDLKYSYITNDSSIVPRLYNKAKYMPKKITMQENTIYDFGGFESSYAVPILKEIDLILIPTTLDSNSIMKTMQIYKEYKDKKIIIIANMMENKKEEKKFEKLFKKYIPNIEILYLKRAKLLKNALESGMSASELYVVNKKNEYVYKSAFKEYKKIIEKLQQIIMNEETFVEKLQKEYI
jgi:MinD-like ATPase involved in chromosome partitioning or flagellar assembly